jgi:hypothetical protein
MANSNARVSQIVAQILRTPVPPSNARVSQIVSQNLRSVEAQYSPVAALTGSRTAIFKGVRNLAFKPLPYNLTCESDHSMVQSMTVPSIVTTAFAGPNHVSPAIAGVMNVLTPTEAYTFELAGGTGLSTFNANPVIFGQRLFGADNNGDFYHINNPGTLPFVGTKPVGPPPGQPGGSVLPRGDMQIIAVAANSNLGGQLVAGYDNPNSFLSGIFQLLQFLLNPPSAIESLLLGEIEQALFGNGGPNLLACGFQTDWTSGSASGAMAYQIASCLASYDNQFYNFPTLTGYKVPTATFGGDPEAYIGRLGQICCDFVRWNSWQWWTNNSAFGPSGPQIYDFNANKLYAVTLDDSATNGEFQTFANDGGALVATPQGWIAGLANAYGLSPSTKPLLIAPDFTWWQLLNFIPSTASGNTLITTNEPLLLTADKNGFYIGTSGNDYQYSGASSVSPTTPAVTPTNSPIATGCQNVDCAINGLAFEQGSGVL